MTARRRTAQDYGLRCLPTRTIRIARRGQREHGHLRMGSGLGTQPPEEFLIGGADEMLDALRWLMEERSAVLL